MNKNEYFTIKGYINILNSAPPNGRHVHKIKNKLACLQMHLDMKISLPSKYEYEITQIIRELFGNSASVKKLDK